MCASDRSDVVRKCFFCPKPAFEEGELCFECTRIAEAADDDEDELHPEACPGCRCLPGDGVTASCTHPDGCGFAR